MRHAGWTVFALVATLMTLTFLPALYVLCFGVKEPLAPEIDRGETVAVPVARSAVTSDV